MTELFAKVRGAGTVTEYRRATTPELAECLLAIAPEARTIIMRQMPEWEDAWEAARLEKIERLETRIKLTELGTWYEERMRDIRRAAKGERFEVDYDSGALVAVRDLAEEHAHLVEAAHMFRRLRAGLTTDDHQEAEWWVREKTRQSAHPVSAVGGETDSSPSPATPPDTETVRAPEASATEAQTTGSLPGGGAGDYPTPATGSVACSFCQGTWPVVADGGGTPVLVLQAPGSGACICQNCANDAAAEVRSYFAEKYGPAPRSAEAEPGRDYLLRAANLLEHSERDHKQWMRRYDGGAGTFEDSRFAWLLAATKDILDHLKALEKRS